LAIIDFFATYYLLEEGFPLVRATRVFSIA
jgi:hypothetical protein